jgi:hypothetical protein
MIRMVCILLFEGFTEEEIIELEEQELDLNNNILYNREHTKKIYLSEELKNIFKNTVGITSFELPSSDGKHRTLQLPDNHRLYRRVEYRSNSNESLILKFRSILSILKNKYYKITYEQISLSPQNIIDSGIFYRLYQKEKNGEILIDNDFSYNVNKELDVTWQRDKININKRLYRDWKEAFELKV